MGQVRFAGCLQMGTGCDFPPEWQRLNVDCKHLLSCFSLMSIEDFTFVSI